jgi:ABC-type multidrug transport system fused ATPase/permease subunit
VRRLVGSEMCIRDRSNTLSQLKLTRIVIAHRPETIARADRQINFSVAA